MRLVAPQPPSTAVHLAGPETGKTQVLSTTETAASLKKHEVVIVANTHQAANNALLKIRQLDKNIPLSKIGELLKAEKLDD